MSNSSHDDFCRAKSRGTQSEKGETETIKGNTTNDLCHFCMKAALSAFACLGSDDFRLPN